MFKTIASGFLVAACLGGPLALAQSSEPIKRTPLQRVDLPGGKMMSLMALIEVVPNGVVQRHTHAGIEMFYVLEGMIELDVDGQPAKLFKVGDSAINLAGIAHGGKAGPNGAKLLGTFIVDKDKPLATPTP